ncbi:hypothetical protein GCM10025768_23250 [Microbacterium pseudoresistens]|uniref:DUF2975 domain-containing protein n=1 Tax=Microbacterium pseudoresistens TaxID=640634 RepID=A0A7Y9JLR9_9MICO|nr:hypothetical protein [Microbacterium pseudoresistens]NYD53620.1 hypothetical protein [Microbacterium pseudoresistens]
MSLISRGHPSRGEGFVLGLVATGAVSVAAAAIVAVVKAVIALFQPAVEVRMPVQEVDASALSGLPGISAAAYDSATVTMTELSAGARWMLLLEASLPALATVGVCAAAWWLGVSLIRARPFRRSMAWTIGVAACLVIAGGLFGQLAGAIGRAIAVDGIAAADPRAHDVFWAFLVQLDLAPLGWGFALALVATAFQVGERMQRDTKGLV